jgi:hypothetical protein
MPNEKPNRLRWDLFRFYPLDRIERFFTALRIVTGLYTGFAQVCIRPIGWSKGWVAALPPVIKGAAGRRYPPWFDEWGWLAEPPPAVTDKQLTDVAVVDHQLEKAPAQIALAGRRLSAAILREHEDDRSSTSASASSLRSATSRERRSRTSWHSAPPPFSRRRPEPTR